jgi:hypothetical protein
MARDPSPPCPACGSHDVERVPLVLIAARYYKCGACTVTFRQSPPLADAAHVDRFDTGFPPPYRK